MTKKTDYLRITSDLRESSDNIAQLNRRIDLSELVGYKRNNSDDKCNIDTRSSDVFLNIYFYAGD